MPNPSTFTLSFIPSPFGVKAVKHQVKGVIHNSLAGGIPATKVIKAGIKSSC